MSPIQYKFSMCSFGLHTKITSSIKIKCILIGSADAHIQLVALPDVQKKAMKIEKSHILTTFNTKLINFI